MGIFESHWSVNSTKCISSNKTALKLGQIPYQQIISCTWKPWCEYVPHSFRELESYCCTLTYRGDGIEPFIPHGAFSPLLILPLYILLLAIIMCKLDDFEYWILILRVFEMSEVLFKLQNTRAREVGISYAYLNTQVRVLERQSAC